METRKPRVRDLVTYRDSHGEEHPAFVCSVHGEGEKPLLNVVFLAGTDSKRDAYGRETLHATSIRHASERTSTGISWRWSDEELGPEPEPAPRQVRR